MSARDSDRKRELLGLYNEPDDAADAVSRLRGAGFGGTDIEVISATPYPEGAFGEHVKKNKLFRFSLFGAFIGFITAFLFVFATQTAFPLVTGGKPILAIPASMIIMYEFTLLVAMIFTVIGVIFESRLPRPGGAGPLYDARITLGYIGLLVTVDESRIGNAQQALQSGGAEEVINEPA